jgi:hypothetical protein
MCESVIAAADSYVVVAVIYSEAVLELYIWIHSASCWSHRESNHTEIYFLNDFHSRSYIPKNQPQYVRNVSIYR